MHVGATLQMSNDYVLSSVSSPRVTDATHEFNHRLSLFCLEGVKNSVFVLLNCKQHSLFFKVNGNVGRSALVLIAMSESDKWVASEIILLLYGVALHLRVFGGDAVPSVRCAQTNGAPELPLKRTCVIAEMQGSQYSFQISRKRLGLCE